MSTLVCRTPLFFFFFFFMLVLERCEHTLSVPGDWVNLTKELVWWIRYKIIGIFYSESLCLVFIMISFTRWAEAVLRRLLFVHSCTGAFLTIWLLVWTCCWKLLVSLQNWINVSSKRTAFCQLVHPLDSKHSALPPYHFLVICCRNVFVDIIHNHYDNGLIKNISTTNIDW